MPESLEVFEQEPTIIGQFGERQVAVYPPSLSRIRKITDAIRKSKTTLFAVNDTINDLREKIKADPDNDKLKAEFEVNQKEFSVAVREQINEIAPIIVMMTAKPGNKEAGYKWESVFTDEDFSDGMPNRACVKIINAYDELSQIAEALKKISALSR